MAEKPSHIIVFEKGSANFETPSEAFPLIGGQSPQPSGNDCRYR
jgi:hypothetical protein